MKTIFDDIKTVLFQGDSITDCGRDYQNKDSLGAGYPAKIAGIWENIFPEKKLTFINRGISGNRAIDLLGRYETDFKALRPDLVSILIGINDTWRRYDSGDPTTAADFEKNYRTLLENLKRDLPKAIIVIMEPFLLETTPPKDWREDLDPKIQAVRNLAKEYADVFVPLDGIFTRYAVEGLDEAAMAADGVHPTPTGHGIIALQWLKALGVLV
ncbi:lipase [Spirochaetia bacterium]|nr:lipase [Spirochaetia bacterium]